MGSITDRWFSITGGVRLLTRTAERKRICRNTARC